MMRNRIAAQLRPPVFEGDEDKTRIAGLLHVMLLSLFVIGLVLASLGVLVEKSHPAVLASVGVLSATVLVLLAVLRRGHIRLASVLLLSVFFANAVICVWAVGSIRVPVASFFILCVLIACLLLGYGGIVAVTALSLAALGLLGWAEEAGLLPPLGKAGFSPYLTHMGLLIWTAVLLILAKRGLDNALKRARCSERRLGERNRRLEEEITERQRAEAALRNSERRLIAAQHIAGMGDFTWDVNTGEVTWSDALFELLGYDRSEHIDFERVNADIHHPDELPRILEWMYGCVASGGNALTPNEYRVLRADGTTLFVRATGVIERGPGGSAKVFATVEDVTERKQAELALRESEEKYRTIFQSPSHGFYLMTDVFLDCNEQACRLYACERADIVGHSPVEFSPAEQPDGRRSEDAAREHIEAAQAGAPQRFYWQHKRKDGVLIDCEVTLDAAPMGGRMLLLASVQDITERKRAEDALQRLTAILEATSDLVSISTTDLKVSYMNRAGRRLLGWAEQEMPEGAGIAKVHPQWAFELVRDEGIPSAIADGPWHGETAILGPEGEEIPVSQVIMVHRSSSGKVEYMSTIIRDIRERKEAEARVQEEKAFTDAVMNSLPGVFYVYEDGTSLIRWNRNMEVSTGFTPEELRHKHPLDWFDEADRETIKTALEEAMRTGYNTVAADMIIKNGARVPYLFSGAVLERGGKTYLLGMGIDVTERKRVEEALMLTQFAVDQASEGIFWMESDGRFIYVNEAACRALGYSREELLNMTVFDIDPDFTQEMWQATWEELRQKKVVRLETRHQAKDGRVYPVEISANFVEFMGRQHNCAFAHDISGRKAIEREREELLRTLAAKNEELESIIYVSSHDLRSPLINIDGFAGELQSSIERIRTMVQTAPEKAGATLEIERAIEELPESLAFISAGVHKMSSLLDGLLRLCRLGRVALEIQRVDAYAAFGRILDTMQYQIAQAQAEVVVDSDVPACLADPNLFNQVFTNLLDNAIKYRDPGRPLFIHISGRGEAGRTVYEVADNGKGIALQHQKKAFEVFHRLDPYDSIGGEGLGLTIVKRLLDRLGGTIAMTSQPGKGTTFAISLPGA